MATLVLRNIKGSPLSNTEADNNFQYLNNALGANGSTVVPTPSGSGSPVLTDSPTINSPYLTGNVGIGTNLPVATLDVHGASGILGQFYETTSGNSRRIRFSNSGAVNTIESTTGSGTTSLAFTVDGTERMRIDSSGYVGIGTTTPNTKLDVNGSISISSGTTALGFLFNDSSAVNLQAASNALALKLGTTTSQPIVAYTNGTERMRIDASGNVGIGTNSPSSDSLTITKYKNLSWAWDNNATYANIFNQSTSASLILASGYKLSGTPNSFASSFGGSWSKSAIEVGGTGAIRFFIDPATSVAIGTDITPTERMRIDSSGNVGIGTNSPPTVSKLAVAGNISSMSGGKLLLWDSTNNYTPYIQSPAADVVSFFSNSGTERMRIDSSGNVGIGITTPSTILEVKDSSSYITEIRSSSNADLTTIGTSIVRFGGTNDVSSGFVGFYGNSTLGLYNKINGSVTISTNSVERMRIDSSGNVGIGTNSPPTKLAVAGNISSMSGGKLYLWDSSNNYTPYIQSPAADVISFFSNSGAERMRIDSSGNVGIGTSSPTAKLHVSGDIKATGDIIAFSTSDKKYKENILDIPNCLDKVVNIGSKYFDWTDEYLEKQGGEDGYFLTKSSFGQIAQTVQQVFPEGVKTRPDGTLAIDPKIYILAFGAIAELLERIKILESK